jgi:uncharacterized membrane protein YoaK (UPF0700 family)
MTFGGRVATSATLVREARASDGWLGSRRRSSISGSTKSSAPAKSSDTAPVEAKDPTASASSVDSRATQALLIVLSVVAGCTDIIGFLGLNGLFTAHITGNLAFLAARIVGGSGEVQIAQMLSVPVFIVVVGLAVVLVGRLESMGLASLHLLLLLQFLLLASSLLICDAAGPRIDLHASSAVVVGMLGVSAMAIQNVLVQKSLKGAPSTAVMTTNVTRFAMAAGSVLVGGDPARVVDARNEAARILPVVVGFVVGCAIGAACEAALGLMSLGLPTGLALLAFVMGFAVQPVARKR